MIRAAYSGEFEFCKKLIDNGAALNHRSKSDFTALMFAAQNGHLEIAKLLVESGASVNLKNNLGRSAKDLANQQDFGHIRNYLTEHSGI